MRGGVVAIAMVVGVSAVATAARAQDLRIDEGPELLDQPGVVSTSARGSSGGLIPEPEMLTRAIERGFDRFGDTGTPANGVYAELSNMITGSGWVSIGPGYRREVFNRDAFIDVSAAVSWRAYNMMQGRFEFPRLAGGHFSIGTQVMWEDETQVKYFGIGPDSLAANESQYRMQTVDGVAYATIRPKPSLALTGEFGFLRRPHISAAGGTFVAALPTTFIQFPADPGVSDAFQPNYAHSEFSLTSDTRDHRSRPTAGGVYRAALDTFVDQSTSTGSFTFRRYEAEGAQFVPVTRDREWVLAFHGWLVWTDLAPGRQVPFYLLPSIGGNNSIRSFPDYRFHDLNATVINAESRWQVFTHMDLAAFYDAGNVGPRVQDLNFDKTGVGAGLRFHTDKTTFARVDVAHGAEGWQFMFRTSDPLRLSRLTRRVAAVPFVP